MRTWQAQEVKSRFSEVVNLALREGPQLITRRGKETVVIVAAENFRRLGGQTANLVDCLLHAPRGEPLEADRYPDPVQRIAL